VFASLFYSRQKLKYIKLKAKKRLLKMIPKIEWTAFAKFLKHFPIKTTPTNILQLNKLNILHYNPADNTKSIDFQLLICCF